MYRLLTLKFVLVFSRMLVERRLSHLASQVSAMANVGCAYLNAGIEYTRVGTAHPTSVETRCPLYGDAAEWLGNSVVPYQVFATKDGNLMIGTGNDTQVEHPAVFCREQALNYWVISLTGWPPRWACPTCLWIPDSVPIHFGSRIVLRSSPSLRTRLVRRRQGIG
jgi:hypothetical protein